MSVVMLFHLRWQRITALKPDLLRSNAEVRATLTSDVGKVLSTLHKVEVGGTMNLLTGLRIAHVSMLTIYWVSCTVWPK